MKRKWLWFVLLGFICIFGISLVSGSDNTVLQAKETSTETTKLKASDASQELTKQSIQASSVELAEDSAVFSTGLELSFPEKIQAGDKGALDFDFSLDGVKFTGNYVVYYDDELLSIDSEGNWEALRDGATTIIYGYQPSAEMLAELKAADKGLKQCNLSIGSSTANSALTSAGMSLDFPAQITEGETGQLKPSISIADKEYNSEYVYYFDPTFLSIDEDGNWKALESGTTQVIYAYQLDEKLKSAIAGDAELEDKAASLGYEELQISNVPSDEMPFDNITPFAINDETQNVEISLGMRLENFPEETYINTRGTFEPVVDMTGAVFDGVDYSSVKFEGEFVYYGESNYISIEGDKYKFLQTGTTNIAYGYIPSEQMKADMIAVAEAQGKTLDFSIFPLATTKVEVQYVSETTLNDGMILKGPSEVTVGDSGTFDITIDPSALNREGMDFSHIKFDGDYVFHYNESLISVDDKGNWKALKSGEANIIYAWRPSDAMWDEMQEVIGDKEFYTTAIAMVHPLTIKDPIASTDSSSSSDPSDSSGKDPGGKLPQTGETQSVLIGAAGILLLAGAVVVKKRHERNS